MTTNVPTPTSRRWCRKVAVPEQPANPDAVAALDRWQMYLPGDHPLWDRYCILACTLADLPGVKPAVKHFPQATHEVSVHAIDPKYPADKFDAGGVQLMSPVNHCVQVVSTDEKVNAAVEAVARLFVDGQLIVEPSGITGARELFESRLRALCEDLAVHPGEAVDPQPYLQIPAETAAGISVKFEKDIVVVVAIDRAHDKTHITTFGRVAKDKDEAAALGEFLLRRMCDVGVALTEPRVTFEDFRRDAAKIKEENDRLREVVTRLVGVAERSALLCSKPSILCDDLNTAIATGKAALAKPPGAT